MQWAWVSVMWSIAVFSYPERTGHSVLQNGSVRSQCASDRSVPQYGQDWGYIMLGSVPITLTEIRSALIVITMTTNMPLS